MSDRTHEEASGLTTDMTPSAADDLGNLAISQHLHCRRCGYDLLGLNPRSMCPECGLDVWETVIHTVDAAANRLPQLRNPSRVGNGLAVLTWSIASAVVLQAIPAMTTLIDELKWFREPTAHLLPPWIGALSIVPVICGLFAVWAMSTPKAHEPSHRVIIDLRLIALGLLGWGSLSSIVPLLIMINADPFIQILTRLFAAPFAILGLWGLRGTLKVIGDRSRAYRRSRGARQSIDSLIAAQSARVAGYLILLVALLLDRHPTLEIFGKVIVWASTLLLFIGLIYLVRNGWMIRSSLVRPPPGLDEITGPKRNLTGREG
jgi:hypothetical protein